MNIDNLSTQLYTAYQFIKSTLDYLDKRMFGAIFYQACVELLLRLNKTQAMMPTYEYKTTFYIINNFIHGQSTEKDVINGLTIQKNRIVDTLHILSEIKNKTYSTEEIYNSLYLAHRLSVDFATCLNDVDNAISQPELRQRCFDIICSNFYNFTNSEIILNPLRKHESMIIREKIDEFQNEKKYNVKAALWSFDVISVTFYSQSEYLAILNDV